MALDIVVLTNSSYNKSLVEFNEKFPYANNFDILDKDLLKKIANSANTSQFWIILPDVNISDYDFSFEADDYERKITNLFMAKNSNDYTAILINKRQFLLYLKTNMIKNIYNLFDLPPNKVQSLRIGNSFNSVKNQDLDIIFISYYEETAEENFEQLVNRFGARVKRVNGVKGILEAHSQASILSSTHLFYVVDADAMIVPTFHFDFHKNEDVNLNSVYIWQSLNPINSLIYGHGGVKLFNKAFFSNVEKNMLVDMTTSIAHRVCEVPKISCIGYFNTSPLATWKTAFRECVKLASGTIKNSDPEQNANRLHQWTTVANESEDYYKFCLDGAENGKAYGIANADNDEALRKINDFTWIKNRFYDIFRL